MNKLKFFVNDINKLNEYEKQHNKISYKTLIDYLFTDMILCNNIDKADAYLFDNVVSGGLYDEDNDTYTDIYQYFIVDMHKCSYDFIEKYLQNNIILFYSDVLDVHVLGVDHFGTSWSYVLTGIEYTTEYKESMQYYLYRDEE